MRGAPTCSRARASLLTGRHECYAGVTHTIKLRDRLSLKSRTLADMLKGDCGPAEVKVDLEKAPVGLWPRKG